MLKRITSLLFLTALIAFCSRTQAQNQPTHETINSHINHQAALSRAGDVTATTELVHQLYKNVSVPTDVADAFGYTDRVVQAETAFRSSQHSAIHESDIVKSVNNFADSIGAPAWVHTNRIEVRKLRMHMLTLYPQLMASHAAPDAKHHYKPLDDDMRPVEGTYVAMTLLYQKMSNPDYQFTDAEKKANSSLSADAKEAKHQQRVKMLRDMFNGNSQSISVRDVLPLTDHLFNDLGIQSTSSAEALGRASGHYIKGGR